MTNPPSKSPNPSYTPFQVNWLQALTLAAKYPSALQVKPLISDIDALGSFQDLPTRQAAAERVWKFATDHSLVGLLKFIPFAESRWRFSDEDRFTFESPSSPSIDSLASWSQAIGACTFELEMVAEVTQLDWTELLRKEMMSHGRVLSMSSMSTSPTGALLRVPCTASWDGSAWIMAFRDPAWLKLRFEERFHVARPSISMIEESLQWAIAEGSELTDSKKPCSAVQASLDWIGDVPRLEAFHRQFESQKVSTWFRRAWNCVWPVLYREENRLKSPCDLAWIRTELAECFRDQPKLTLWMFAFGKILCNHQLGRGTGSCGEYLD